MEEVNRKISLHLENNVTSAMITMFGTLSEIRNGKEAVISEDRKSVTIRTKNHDEIIELNFDYKDLEDKIFSWFHSAQPFLHLNEGESDIFRNCSHAAYYFLLEDKKMTKEHIERNHFVKLHEHFFRKK